MEGSYGRNSNADFFLFCYQPFGQTSCVHVQATKPIITLNHSNLMICRHFLVGELFMLLEVSKLVFQSQCVCIQCIERALQVCQTSIDLINLLQVRLKRRVYVKRRKVQEKLESFFLTLDHDQTTKISC
jgi:hypothetical protein